MVLEIIVIICSILIVGGNITYYIYRKINHKPVGECKYCQKDINKLLKEYRNEYKKTNG